MMYEKDWLLAAPVLARAANSVRIQKKVGKMGNGMPKMNRKVIG